MQKILVSLPDSLVQRMKTIIPSGKRSSVISDLLDKELKRREIEMYKIAQEVEKDEKLNDEMSEWDITIGDGLEFEPW